MGVELPLRVVVTILECCVTFSGVKLSIRSFVLFLQFAIWSVIVFFFDRDRVIVDRELQGPHYF